MKRRILTASLALFVLVEFFGLLFIGNHNIASAQSARKNIQLAHDLNYWPNHRQFKCTAHIFSNESGWNDHADNPGSSAFGIPQALTASMSHHHAAQYKHNPDIQLRWGRNYIHARYGHACNAWSFWQQHRWF